ncbi:unnamed protein product [Phyllotreta striolata]|uniref:Uncharacterized protein n=1 Tax=Phyllotreta striolata TaxID=444603 RepID=A0A9P0DU42_PHYSR|nr:unnamed protein product [Phyllotreta striolata]
MVRVVCKMEEIAFSDWPGQPVDLNSGNNPWLPAYGFAAPSVLLERDDFNGNPDADYFLHGGFNHYAYLETILEETSDDLRSESDADSRASPAGWLATDSETGSVICIDPPDDADGDSDRELACPAKRRKQELYLCLPAVDDDLSSLSRSSSLLQFETLEKQCQEACSTSPGVYSQFSFDLESRKPPEEDESDYYKTIKIDVPTVRKRRSDDSLSLNRSSGSDTSESDVIDISRSFDNLKPWRSFDSLQVNKNGGKENKTSAENLSEDSGYGEHSIKLYTNGYRSKDEHRSFNMKCHPEKRNSYVGFPAYDGDILQEHFNGNFGVSYHDLTVLKDRDTDVLNTARLIESLAKGKKRQANDVSVALNIEPHGNAANFESNFKSSSTSEPNLPEVDRQSRPSTASICVCSVPKDLNLVGGFDFDFDTKPPSSVAAKDWNLADFRPGECNDAPVAAKMGDFKRESSYAEAMANSNYKREGSYTEAMTNRVDLSDDEHSLYNRNKPKLPKSTIVEFDKQVLKAISEQSIQSLINSNQNLQDIYIEQRTPIVSTPKRNVVSTPNLSIERDDEQPLQNPRKSSATLKSSPSSSSSNSAEKLPSLGSFSGSLNSKGVHFSPVVSEVNWRDDSVSTVTPDRESSCSLGDGSTPERPSLRRRVVKSKSARLSCSQPELSDGETSKREFLRSLRSLREDLSKSQPEVARFRRRGSQLVKKDKDGSVIKAYVDRDGIQYKHTHLDAGYGEAAAPPALAGAPTGDRSAPDGRSPVPRTRQPVGAMEVGDAHGDVARVALKDAKRSKATGKLGGFFSRLAGFRFSLRKGADEAKGKTRKKGGGGGGGVATVVGNAPGATMAPHQQRLATKSDYIYIPLKGPTGANPTSHSNATRPNHQDPAVRPPPSAATASLASKPPLPKQPPRVVHASVKPSAHAAPGDSRQHRRRTIDSTAGGPLSMEPMGLIETDLDTEVTVITSGANAKTRSLLDLGPQPRRLTLAVDREGDDQHRTRPHKSMEFLLDKQNLKVVEGGIGNAALGGLCLCEKGASRQREGAVERLKFEVYTYSDGDATGRKVVHREISRKKRSLVSSRYPFLIYHVVSGVYLEGGKGRCVRVRCSSTASSWMRTTMTHLKMNYKKGRE